MVVMKFADLSRESERSHLVMWQVKDPCPDLGGPGIRLGEK